MPPIDDPIRDKIDLGFPDLAVGPVESAHEGLARKDRTRLYVKHRALVGFVQADGLEHHTRPEIMRCTYGGCGAADFIRCQWIQRMPRWCNGAGFCNSILHAVLSTFSSGRHLIKGHPLPSYANVRDNPSWPQGRYRDRQAGTGVGRLQLTQTAAGDSNPNDVEVGRHVPYWTGSSTTTGISRSVLS